MYLANSSHFRPHFFFGIYLYKVSIYKIKIKIKIKVKIKIEFFQQVPSQQQAGLSFMTLSYPVSM